MNAKYSYALVLSYSGFCCGLLILCPSYKSQRCLGFCPESLFFSFYLAFQWDPMVTATILVFMILPRCLCRILYPQNNCLPDILTLTLYRYLHFSIDASPFVKMPYLLTAIISHLTAFPTFLNNQQLLNAGLSPWPQGLCTAGIKHMKKSSGKDGMKAFHGQVTRGNYFQEVLFHLFCYCIRFPPVTQMMNPSEIFMKFVEDTFTSFWSKGNLALRKGSRNGIQLNPSRVLQKEEKRKMEKGTLAISEHGYQTSRKREWNPSRKCL